MIHDIQNLECSKSIQQNKKFTTKISRQNSRSRNLYEKYKTLVERKIM